MLEEMNVVLIIPFVTEVFPEAPGTRHIVHSPGFCSFERLLQVQSVTVMVLTELFR